MWGASLLVQMQFQAVVGGTACEVLAQIDLVDIEGAQALVELEFGVFAQRHAVFASDNDAQAVVTVKLNSLPCFAGQPCFFDPSFLKCFPECHIPFCEGDPLVYVLFAVLGQGWQ